MATSPLRLLLTLVASTLLATACGNDDEGSAERDSPSEVAVAYTQAIASGDWSAARSYVAKDDQDTFRILSDAGEDVQTRGEDLSAGNESVDGREATVIILGRLCSTPPDEAEQCVDNEHPASENPIFIVHLINNEGWEVHFPSPVGQ